MRSMLYDGYSVSYGVTTSDQSGLPLTTHDGVPVEPAASAGRTLQLLIKRVLDLLLAIVAMLVLSPIILGTALALRVSGRGPVLVSEARLGLGGRTFRMLSFRRLPIDARPPGRRLQAIGVEALPQLLNVIAGDMALVGPRPMAPEASEAIAYSDYRHHMRPGLASWAEAGGRLSGATYTDKQRLDHDCAYVQNFSLWLDAKIIIRTVLRESRTGSDL